MVGRRGAAGTRGVLMTASSRKPGQSWKEEQEGLERERHDSHKEWDAILGEIQAANQAKQADADLVAGRLSNVADYEDAVSDDDLGEAPPRRQPQADDEEGGGAREEASEPELPPQSTVTAGQEEEEENKEEKRSEKRTRGGRKKTGNYRKVLKDAKVERQRKRDAADGDDDAESKKRRKKDDPDRWVHLQLQGEEKQKKVDATRVVHYFDFDVRVAEEAQDFAAANLPLHRAPARNFREYFNDDLFAEESEEEAATGTAAASSAPAGGAGSAGAASSSSSSQPGGAGAATSTR